MAYAKPTLTLNSTTGRYSAGTKGVCYTLTGPDGYYIYAKNPNTGVYWRKDEKASSSGVDIYLGANATTSDQYYTYVFLSSEDSGDSKTFGSEVEEFLVGVAVPYIVAQICNASSTPVIYNSAYDTITSWTKEGFVLIGWALHPSVKNALYTDWNTGMDGKKFYTIWYKEQTSSDPITCSYFCGTGDPNTVSVTLTTAEQYIYGTGTTDGGAVSASVGKMNTACAKDDSYSLLGWSTKHNSTKVDYVDAAKAYASGKTSIYGVYYKEESMKYYPQNGQTHGEVSVKNYIYGKTGQTSNYPSAPSLTYDGYELKGWAITSNETPISWKEQWDAGVRVVYAIWVREGNVYYCPVDSNSWILTEVYYGYDNGTSVEWVPVQVKCEDNLTWK